MYFDSVNFWSYEPLALNLAFKCSFQCKTSFSCMYQMVTLVSLKCWHFQLIGMYNNLSNPNKNKAVIYSINILIVCNIQQINYNLIYSICFFYFVWLHCVAVLLILMKCLSMSSVPVYTDSIHIRENSIKNQLEGC